MQYIMYTINSLYICRHKHYYIHYTILYYQVTYFKEIGMWFLPDNNPTCETATGMKTWLHDHPQQQQQQQQQFNRENNQNLLLEYCCQNGKYWENMPKN